MPYFDHAATTQPRPEALQAMWPFLSDQFGNASSVHERGHHAADALARARTVVAELAGALPNDVIFTSGGTEADNLGIVGLALANPRGKHLVSARTEHEAVLQSIAWLERMHGFTTTWVPVARDGSITLSDLRAALRSDTTLVSLMAVNNEIGTVHPIRDIAAHVHEAGALMHCDAVQAAGWVDLRALGADALSISGHKLGAPQGVGAAIIRSRLPLEPTVWGGGQQDGRRSGTENVAGAVALATALALAERDRLSGASERIAGLRDELIAGVRGAAPMASLTGPSEGRAPQIASFVFSGLNGETVLIELERRGVVCSSGSACAAGSTEPSHVLIAGGYAPELAHTSVRFSLGVETTQADVAAAISAVHAVASELTGLT